MNNRKLSWKEAKKERDVEGVSLRTRREDGMLVGSKEEVKGEWKRHVECLMNGGAGGEAIVMSVGMAAGKKQMVCEHREIERVEVEKAIPMIKCGKPAAVDEITQEIMKHGGNAVIQWMTMICDLA